MADTFVLLDTLPPQFFKVDGETIVPLSGGSLESFASGTTTPQNVYDADGNSLGSVLTLDSRGEIMTVKNIWLKVGDDYKFRLKDADGVEVWTVDNITTDQGIREFSDAITINVPSAKAPMVLNALAQGQLVTGLNADQVDGAHVGTNNGNVVLRENLSSAAQAATESAQGVAEIATQAEVDAETDDSRFITAKKLAAYSGLNPSLSMDLLDTVDMAGTAAQLTTGIDSTYDVYLITLNNVTPASGTANLQMRTSSDGGVSYDTGLSDYAWVEQAISADAAEDGINRDALDTEIVLVTGFTEANGSILLFDPANSGKNTFITCTLVSTNVDNDISFQNVAGRRSENNIVDAIQFNLSSGSIGTGKVRLYGLKN